MLTQCPHCEKAIVVPEPGIHSCPKCRARIWVYPADSDKADRVLISPEVMEAQQRDQRGRPRDPDLAEMVRSDQLTAPWEERRVRGGWSAFKSTWKASTFAPSMFFSKLKTDPPARGVLSYGWLILTVGYLLWGMYRLYFLPMIIEASRESAHAVAELPPLEDMRLITMGVMLLSPLTALVSLYVNAGLFHLILRLIGAAKTEFSGTFRVVVYATSPMLFMAFPLFGDFAAFVWSMVVSVIGLSRIHGISSAKSMLVVFFPPLAFYVLLLLGARAVESLSIAPFVLP